MTRDEILRFKISQLVAIRNVSEIERIIRLTDSEFETELDTWEREYTDSLMARKENLEAELTALNDEIAGRA